MNNKEGLLMAIIISIGMIIGSIATLMIEVETLTLVVPSILVYIITFIEVKLRKKEIEKFIPSIICAILFDVVVLLWIAYF